MKKFVSAFLALLLICCMIPPALSADQSTQAADVLYELGLFKGTGTNPDGTPIYDLGKTPTRNQAIIMLVRLLGKEDEAKAGAWDIPFTDVSDAMRPYIGYAYANGLTNGYTATTYNGGAPIKAILLRYFNPIGSHPTAIIGEMPNGVPMNLIPYVTQTAMGIREQLKIFGNDYDTPDGTCIRDYIYVVDLAKAHVAAMARIVDGKNTEPVEIYNVGTGKGVSVLELINTFEKCTGVKLNYEIAPRRAGDIEKVWGNVDKANQVLGWKAVHTLEEALTSAWNWQQKLRERGIM